MIKHNIQFITDNYVFTIELDNASNILLQEETVYHEHSIIEAIIQFILFVHTHKIQYLTIYDSKKRDRYMKLLKKLLKDERVRNIICNSYFIYDGDTVRCKLY